MIEPTTYPAPSPATSPPPNGSEVLAFTTQREWIVVFYSDELWINYGGPEVTVTHWLPLPPETE